MLTPESSCNGTKTIPDKAYVQRKQRLRRDFCIGGRLCRAARKLTVTHPIVFMPHFAASLTGVRTVAEVNERGLESTEREVNIQERGLEFSSPNFLPQPLFSRCKMSVICSSPVSLLLILYRLAFLVGTKSYPV